MSTRREASHRVVEGVTEERRYPSTTWNPAAPSATAVKLMPAAAHARPFVVRITSRTALPVLLTDLLNRGSEPAKAAARPGSSFRAGLPRPGA